jgi:hypothetical protein
LIRHAGLNPVSRNQQESPLFLVRKVEGFGKLSCGVRIRMPDDASFQIAHRPSADECSLGQILLRQPQACPMQAEQDTERR